MPKKIKLMTEMDVVDSPTMHKLTDDQYREFLQDSGLMWVDHHDILRSTPAGYPLATRRAQVDILIEELQRLRDKVAE